MARKGKSRKVTAKRTPSAKDRHRAAVPGRRSQGLGSAGRSGGTKSAGGKGGRVQGGRRGGGAQGPWGEGAARPDGSPPAATSRRPRKGGWRP